MSRERGCSTLRTALPAPVAWRMAFLAWVMAFFLLVFVLFVWDDLDGMLDLACGLSRKSGCF